MVTAATSELVVAAPASALAAEQVSVAFDGLRVLQEVSIEVSSGEIVGVIGPNGAGKTTLFDCLSGFVPCDGRVWVAGHEVTGTAPHRRARAGLGRSFQDARLYHSLTVLDTLRVAAELHVAHPWIGAAMVGSPRSRRAEADATRMANEQVETLGLEPYRDKLVRELSTGTRRVVDLGCLLLQRPAVVLLDEPSSGIAQREVEALRPLLLRVREETGCAMVLIEHDMPLLLGLAERVYALETGTVIADGRPDDVVHHPEVIRSYLGADSLTIDRSGSTTATRTRKRKR
jgi:ABC-type branched-subunit amino acid transport system ATPase component